MNTILVKKFIVSSFIILSLITSGFIGILVFHGILDEGNWSAEAATIRYVGGTGPGNYTKIQEAIDNANPGDTIYVWNGTYHENVIVNKSVTLIGNGTTKTTIDGGGTSDVMKITVDWVNVSGFKIINSGSQSLPNRDAGIELYAVENVTISNNTCSNNYIGIFVDSSKSNTIINNTCNSNIANDLYLSYSDSNKLINNNLQSICLSGIRLYRSKLNEINNNKCDSKTGSGMVIKESDNNILTNNTCNWNTLHGIEFMKSGSNRINHNTCNLNTYYGIVLEKSSSNIFENNTWLYNEFGISAYGSDSLTIRNNTASVNLVGIYLDESPNCKIMSNFCNNNNHGIFVSTSNYTTIENSHCNRNTDDGIHFYNSNSSTVANNSFSSNLDSGLTLTETISSTILKNNMYLCGLEIYGTKPEYWNSHTIDTSNNIDNKPIYYRKFRSGGTIPIDAGQVILANCTNIQIEKLSIKNANPAVAIAFSSFNTVTNNTLLENTNGVYLYSSNSNIISNNNCSFNRYRGIDLRYSSNNRIDNNTCISNYVSGIFLYYSESNTITNNNVSSSINRGILLNSSIKNTIFHNDIQFNDQHGLYIIDSSRNNIYHNNIIENAIQAVELEASHYNEWDNGNGEGNYWSDYIGLDNGAYGRVASDGIGDTQLLHLDLDKYPFIKRSGWLYPARPILIDPGDFDSDGNFLVSWPTNRGTIGFILEEDTDLNFNSSTVVYEGPEQAFQVKNRNNNTYYYRLKAYSEQNVSHWSNIVDITVDWVPDRPQNLSASVFQAGNALNLSWDLNSVDTKEYNIHYKTNDVWIFLVSVTHPKHSFDHSDLKDGLEYHYRIEAIDGRGQSSGFSASISAIPMDSIAPAPPTGLSIDKNKTTHHSIKLIWEANTEDDLKGYNLYKSNFTNPDDPWDLMGNTRKGQEDFVISNLEERKEYYFAITAFDEVPNESVYSNTVSETTKLGPHGPEIFNSIADIEILEDSYDDTSINLYDWFSDINDDPLTFECEGEKHIKVTIYQKNGTVVLKPDNDWNGNETLTFYASDGEYVISDKVMINVLPINDPPMNVQILAPQNGSKFDYGQPVYFRGTYDDPDLPDDNLTFNWSSSIDSILGEDIPLTVITLSPGEHIITLTVTDSGNNSCIANVTITVLKVNKSLEDDTDMSLIMTSVSAIIIVILLILILFLILKRKKEDKKTGTEKKKPVTDQKFIAHSPQLPLSSKRPFDPTTVQRFTPLPAKPLISKSTVTPKLTPASPSPTRIQPDITKIIISGNAYIIQTKGPVFGLNIFEKELVKTKNRGLCITRTHPSKLKRSAILDNVTKIWLSKTPEKDSVSPGNLTKIAHIISQFLKANPKGIILLDGLDYLIINNDFPRVLKFVEAEHEKIVLSKSVLLIPISPSTMSTKNYEILEKELINTIKDPRYFA
jgi:parallel beta-helix repeat protein